ncbi:Zn-dependent exopeptidase [Hysterangium stoloniferum]|nr:Zn-dependent exopeptidase [Hysterangium stoloniferum]
MAAKADFLDDKNHLPSSTLPLTATSSKTKPHPSAKSRILFRFCHVIFVVGFLYSIRTWYFNRPNGDITSESWLMDVFARPDRGILTGKRAEHVFLKVPDEASALKASRIYAGLPHMAGSDQDLVTAKIVLDHFLGSFGIEPPSEAPIFPAGSDESRSATLDIPSTSKPRAWIDTYYPVLNTPLERSLEIVDEDGNVIWTADLEEDGDCLDEDACQARTVVPAFHGLSKAGNVTGELFYANYCTPEDYDAVESSGIKIQGNIALCRYGGPFRGLKVKGGQDRGAAGVLIYSDVRDDGSVTVKNGYQAYPAGPARNPTSVQRGSVQYLSLYPGDPTTPGYPSYENSPRTEGANIPKIPSLPISWANALKLGEALGKNGTVKVRLVNDVDTKITPIWNTMAVIPGHIKSEVVVLGNHRDAWVLGAADPSSGTATIHEVIRGFAELHKRGWKPLRTILLASWDAEEYGLVGSTEWGEDFASWIKEHVITYINLDSSVSGSRFSAGASPSMAHMLRQVGLDIPHPTDGNRTLWDAKKDKGKLIGPVDPGVLSMAEAQDLMDAEIGLGVQPLGSGSDYTVFLQRIGIGSAQAGFGSTLQDPVYHYHSIYDSQRFQELYADPGFYRHVAVSKFIGLVTLRFADSIILPYNTTFYSLELSNYVEKVANVAAELKFSVDLSPLREAVTKLYKASLKLDEEKEEAEEQLIKIIKRWEHKHRRHHHYKHHHGHGHHENDRPGGRCGGSRWRQMSRFVKGVFGVADKHAHIKSESESMSMSLDPQPKDHHSDHSERHPAHPDHHPVHLHHHHHHWHPQRPLSERPRVPRKLIKAVKRVQAVNKKLSGFESGFISEEGILDRTWYKHLGVAPGKWLGYGATTLPGLTEAITIEKNLTLAAHETERLTTLITKLAKAIKVED